MKTGVTAPVGFWLVRFVLRFRRAAFVASRAAGWWRPAGQDWGDLAADFPVSLRVGEKALTVELPAGIQPPAFGLIQPFPGGTVTVIAPGNWKLEKPLPRVKLAKTVPGWVLTVSAGVRTVELAAK